MAPKSKVEQSPNFEEIHEMLLQGISCRDISNFLKDKYEEDIHYSNICRYAKNHIKLEDKVNHKINEKLTEETEKTVEKQADTHISVSKKTDYVVEINSDNMIGVMKVAAELNSEFEKAKEEANDPNSNITHKDVARLALAANKVVNDYNKSQDALNVEVNVDSYNLSNEFNTDKMRDILNAKQNRNSGNTE